MNITKLRALHITAALGVFLAAATGAYAESAQAPEDLVKKGDLLYRQGKYEEAAKLYDEAYFIVSRESVALPEGRQVPEKLVDEADDYYDDGEYKLAIPLYVINRFQRFCVNQRFLFVSSPPALS